MSLVLILAVFFVMAFVIVSVSAVFEDRRDRAKLRMSLADGMAPLLHSINLDRCIGCEGCVDTCPTNVLSLHHHKVRVDNFRDCVQCEQCEWVCPTNALVMYREGTEPKKLTVPELDPHFQTAVPGQYLIGEVAGKPLVKNAANLGRLVVEHMMADGLAPDPSAGEVIDVAIVGSGPGGLSSGLACLKNGLSCVVLEKEHQIASTVSRYPKGKVFMSEPADSRNLSYLPVFDAVKEDLLAAWEETIKEVNLPIRKGEAVETVKRGEDGIFEIRTTVQTYKARRVILAIGLRGKPRLLAVPGANLPKVHSALENPEAYGGQHVLVVGGGDSALEASMSLADSGATAILSYRSKAFKRAKPANQKRLQEYADAGKVTVLMESNAKCFEDDTVTIKLADGEEKTFPNNQVFLLIGAEAPVGWLEKIGVNFVERPHSYQLGKIDELVLAMVADADDCPQEPRYAVARIRSEVIPAKAAAAPKRRRRARTHTRTGVMDAIASEWTNFVTVVHQAFEVVAPEPKATAAPVSAKRRKIGSVPPPIPGAPRQSVISTLSAAEEASPAEDWNGAPTTVQQPCQAVLDSHKGSALVRVAVGTPAPRAPAETPLASPPWRGRPTPPPLAPAPLQSAERPGVFDDITVVDMSCGTKQT